MRSILTIARREMHSFFVSPIAYVVLTVWLLWGGLSFYLLAAFFAQRQYEPGGVTNTPLTMFFGGSTLFYIVLLVVVPIMTMRLLAEERKTGTIEPLLTAPVTDIQVVIGKYLAAMVFWATLWVPTLLYVLILTQHGELDWGAVGSCYLGVFGIGLYYMAIGLLMSAISRSQIVAAVLTFLMIGTLFLVGIGEYVAEEGTLRDVFSYVSVWGHMEQFAKGIVDTRFLAFDVGLAALALFLTVTVLESRRYQ